MPERTGLILNTEAACPGYTLLAPLNSTTTYLIDLAGRVVHSWPSRYVPGQAAYLLEDGSLLRCGREPRNQHFGGGGIGGRVERISPAGRVEWEFVYADQNHCLHHDIEPLPNGNILMIAWEKKSREEAIAAGRDPEQMVGDEMWPDCIIEVEPHGTRGGRIVWEWHVWDHLVQDFDPSKPNYGVVAEHPELVDLNFRGETPPEGPAEIRRLRGLGYVGGRESREEQVGRPPPRGPGGFNPRADWCHTNAVAYNAKLDQIALSVHNFNEIWIIDHSTTTQEAAGHRGGRYGVGGDLLYRWGNPRAYGAGGVEDQQLFDQHDAHWIPEGCPGAGHLLVFNNGRSRPDGPYSSVVEIAPPVDSSGRYARKPGQAFGPSRPCWEYAAPNKREMFSASISGAQRLPNGNTLVCVGEQGRIIEVSREGTVVWEYINPFEGAPGLDHGPDSSGSGRPPQVDGSPGRPGGPPPDGPENELERRPDGRRPPGAPGPPGWGPPPGRGLFRATRVPVEHPGVRRLVAGGEAK